MQLQPEPDDEQLLRTPVAAAPNEVIDLCDDSAAPASPEPQASTPALASLAPSDTAAQLLRVLSSTYQKSRATLNASEALDPLQRAFDSRHQGLPEQTPTLRHASFRHCSWELAVGRLGILGHSHFVTFTNLMLSLTVSAVPSTQISRRIF